MMIRILTTTIALLIFNVSIGQLNSKYYNFIKKAENLYELKIYQKSADKYQRAFKSSNGKAHSKDVFNAACSLTLSGDIELAFQHLFRLANQFNYKKYKKLMADENLKLLHDDKRWNQLLHMVQSNKKLAEKDYDWPLVKVLDSIYLEDQKYRKLINKIENEYGKDSKEFNENLEIMQQKDSTNLIVIKSILDQHGWLGSNIVGEIGNSTLFLVIQHADFHSQLKYLPLMREAVKQGDAKANDLALLEDRVALGQGKRQIYGSQIGRDLDTGTYYVLPIVDPEKVDQRRAEVGLIPLADYLRYFNIKWSIKRHKKRVSKMYEQKNKDIE